MPASHASPWALWSALTVATVALASASLAIGAAGLPIGAALRGLLGLGDPVATLIVREIRLPRALLAILIGAGLGMAGAALQALLRNPLAEPGIVGVSAMSALGAVIAFYSGLSTVFALALPLGGLAGALASILLLYVCAGRGVSTLGFILAGVAINSLGGALTALALSLAANPYAAYELFFWLMGSLADRSLTHVWLALPFMAVGFVLLLSAAPALDVLALGEEVAASLGVPLPRLRAQIVAGTALVVGPGVAVAGMIGFVGLLVPHLLRPYTEHRPSLLLPLSALGGAALTLAADIVTRLLTFNGELKLGVVTALVGAPFLFHLLLAERHSLA